jgi:hypothetical protein
VVSNIFINAFDRMRKLDTGVKIILVFFVVFHFALFRPVLGKVDPVGYYSWLRSIIIDGDLDTANEFDHFDMHKSGIKVQGGLYMAQPWPIGCAILWSPFFLIAHILVISANFLGVAISSDGYSFPYVFAVSLGTTFYALTGLLITYRIAREYYNDSVSTLAMVSVWLSSPLIFYMYSHPMMSHANDMFVYSLILLLWRRTELFPRDWHNYVLLGVVAALAALVRTQNAPVALLCLGYIIIQVIKHRVNASEGLKIACGFSLAWWVTFSPQMYVWKLTFGQWLPGNPTSLIAGARFHYGFPYLINVLFSSNRGLFVWNPLLIFCVIGWLFLRKEDCSLAYFMFSSFFILLLIFGSWDEWHGVSAFGQRYFVGITPALILGFAALLNYIRKWMPVRFMAAICGMFVLWNLLLIIQYALGTVPRGGPTDLGQLVKNQFLVIPGYLERIVQAWLNRL